MEQQQHDDDDDDECDDTNNFSKKARLHVRFSRLVSNSKCEFFSLEFPQKSTYSIHLLRLLLYPFIDDGKPGMRFAHFHLFRHSLS